MSIPETSANGKPGTNGTHTAGSPVAPGATKKRPPTPKVRPGSGRLPVDEREEEPAPTPAADGKARDYSRVFEQLGVTFTKRSGDEALAETCPFCGKDR